MHSPLTCSPPLPPFIPLQDGAPAGLLPLLDLPQDIIRNVFMSRDIVPRAFACDYTIVADLLRSWGPAWREHHCLQVRRRALWGKEQGQWAMTVSLGLPVAVWAGAINKAGSPGLSARCMMCCDRSATDRSATDRSTPSCECRCL